ncbi:alpha/beta fold hydrolase [Pararhizobium haloflavum]|uniref:alpha/beta fold hydrolase n=1 Tax=Pararhizobium haloflavum TaxID=2037914 RepID=UPI000C19ED2E|nr:alpha/beta hydrolase [Pararhizobium haloflavum]
MNFDRMPMKTFNAGGLNLAYIEDGPAAGRPVVLVHGFASNAHVNWVYPGWVKVLREAGYRAIALDHRGHGDSDKPHDPEAYHPHIMAKDVAALIDHLGLGQAHVFGYSMGARISAFLALERPELVRSLVFGGLGMGMIEGVGDWAPIAEALRAPSIEDVDDEKGRMFRSFAEQTKSDREALAACITTSRTLIDADAISKLDMPVLIGVGTRDDIAGSAKGMADLLPNARAVDIPNRDHMLAVGDRVFKKAVLDFYAEMDA